ncbi:Fur family transcriptional regulator [Aquipuribacter nitratireducens]|uniref:Fur family transcriptional regulator n=1 Tax=Aquipuribacter nitratireducens TaxID=650104 RepID=A0ABW0GR54_9MICO
MVRGPSTAGAAADRLRAAGLRVTRPRVAVLGAVGDHPHATAEEVLTEARRRLGAVSVQGVYDALAALTAAGLVRRIEPQRHPARFETRTDDNHHHAVCRSCGAVSDVDCVVGHAPCLDASPPHGLVSVEEAEVVFWGLCAACAAVPPPDVA